MTIANPQRSNHAVEFGLLALLATLWGASYTFIKLGVATIPPITLIAARTLIAGLLLLIIMRWRGLSLPRDAASWRRFLFQACLNSVIPFTLIAWAERSLDAGLATILNSTAPVFTFLLTFAVTGHERATLRKLLGVLAGLAGTCLIVGVQALGGIGEQFVAQVAVVVATVDRPWTLTPSASSMLALLGLAVFSTALAFVIYFRLIQTLGSVGTTSQAYLRVPIGVAIGVLFLGETLTSTAWTGLGCVVIGVAAMTIPARAAAARPC
jgi:drug/metabolite transporter (DMT)-like permease